MGTTDQPLVSIPVYIMLRHGRDMTTAGVKKKTRLKAGQFHARPADWLQKHRLNTITGLASILESSACRRGDSDMSKAASGFSEFMYKFN
jgi:hypothetical protein